MITAPLHSSPGPQGRLQPSSGSGGYRLSTVALYGRLRERERPKASAIASRKVRPHGFLVLRGSKRDNLDGDHLNGFACFAADQRLADLLEPRVSMVLGGLLRAGFKPVDLAAVIGGNNGMGQRHGGNAGNHGFNVVVDAGHGQIPCFGNADIGHSVRNGQGVISG
jgi:hypothetical protein